MEIAVKCWELGFSLLILGCFHVEFNEMAAGGAKIWEGLCDVPAAETV